MLLQEAGFRKVYCSDIEPKRLEIVQRFGGIPVITGKIGFFTFLLVEIQCKCDKIIRSKLKVNMK